MDELPAYTPQSLTDLLPIYHPSDAPSDPLQTYTLHLTSPSTQTLTLDPPTSTTQPPTAQLHIQTFKTGGFMNRKPHIIIAPSASTSTHPHPGPPLAEARFDIHSTGTGITYPSPSPSHSTSTSSPRTQRLELTTPRLQILSTTIGNHPYYWRPFPGNKDVWELSNEYEEVVARFVHTRSPAPSPPSTPPTRNNSVFSISSATEGVSARGKAAKKKAKEPVVIGQLHVVSAVLQSESEREEVLCSAIVVVERMRRRRGFLEGQGGRYGGEAVGRGGVAWIVQ